VGVTTALHVATNTLALTLSSRYRDERGRYW
jgi:hypothetical protein